MANQLRQVGTSKYLLRAVLGLCVTSCVALGATCGAAKAQDSTRSRKRVAPLEALIDIRTGDGRFRVPNGYLVDRQTPENVKVEQVRSALSFAFSWPSGRFSERDATRYFEPNVAERADVSSDQFLVRVNQMREGTDDDRKSLLPSERLANVLKSSDSTEFAVSIIENTVARIPIRFPFRLYSNKPNADVEFLFRCEVKQRPSNINICDGPVYFHSRNIAVFSVWIPENIVTKADVILRRAIELYFSWKL